MILVVGGAGYIGSHIVKALIRREERVIVLDNLTTGHREAVDKDAIFIEGDLSDKVKLQEIFAQYPVRGVMHFAAFSLVGESVKDPLKYYVNNTAGTLTLLGEMIRYNIKKFIFSSTAAVYGIPSAGTITEESLTAPINPYGQSKRMVEQILDDFAEAYGLEYTVLRYFNAAGADESGEIGEDHSPETHLIPVVLKHLLGQREEISIFGTDYDTKDGTCIRDYIHVSDLADAHLMALDRLVDSHAIPVRQIYNLGNGLGYSVQEIIRKCEEVTGLYANVQYADRRKGDPAVLIASSERIEKDLGWKAAFSLDAIIRTAWNWHQQNPEGYRTQHKLKG